MTAVRAAWRAAWPSVLPAYGVAKLITLAAVIVSVSRGGGLSWASLGQAFSHWDAVSYLQIAAHGYPATVDYHDAFLPGYPLLITAVSVVVRNQVVAGVLVSAVAELAALTAIHALALRERDAHVAVFAVWAIALAPLGFFFSAVYTESSFIAGAALSLLLVRAGRPRGAAMAAAFAVAMRLTGLVLVPVLAVELARSGRLRRGAPWLLLVPVPLVLFALYLRLRTGDALAFVHAESLPAFGESAAWPWDGLRVTWETAAGSTDPTNKAIFIREVVAGLAGLVVVLAAWIDARFPRSFALYCTLVWLMAVSLTFWRSVPRYDLALFPAAIVLADLTTRVRPLRPLLVAAGATVLAWGAFVYAEGGWIG